MELSKPTIFCDYLTVTQTHKEPHQALNGGIQTATDADGNLDYCSARPKQILGDHGSNLQISSDGSTVRFSGNVSRFNRSENFHGVNLDDTKTAINSLLKNHNLPPFSKGETIRVNSGQTVYTGAKISRLDMTANLFTGSAKNCASFLDFVQGQNHPKLQKLLFEKNTYYGRDSDARTIRIYDKAKQLHDVALKQALKRGHQEEIHYLQKLIEYAKINGTIRYEVEFHKSLQYNNCRKWEQATHTKLCGLFQKDLNTMNTKTKILDIEDIPVKALGTLAMYLAGMPVKKLLHRNTFSQHKKILSEYGYDISNQNITAIKPKQKTILITASEVPDFYKHAQQMRALKAV